MSEKIEQLKIENISLRKDISRLESELEKRSSAFEKKTIQFDKKTLNLDKENLKLKRQVFHLEQKKAKLEAEIIELKKNANPTVAELFAEISEKGRIALLNAKKRHIDTPEVP